jgi:predicted secreted protein
MMRPAALAVALLAALPMAVAPVVAQGNTDAPEKKLYRWTDSSGKVHYTPYRPTW